jgi:hypothetical protein
MKIQTVRVNRFNNKEVEFPKGRRSLETALKVVKRGVECNGIETKQMLIINGEKKSVAIEERFNDTMFLIMNADGSTFERVVL